MRTYVYGVLEKNKEEKRKTASMKQIILFLYQKCNKIRLSAIILSLVNEFSYLCMCVVCSI